MIGIDTFAPVTEDDRRNERVQYEGLFFGECRTFLESIYADAMDRMKHCSYLESDETLCVLMFLQEIVATAQWKYRVDAGEELTQFAREFDRLDVDAEKIRLYKLAVGNSGNSAKNE